MGTATETQDKWLGKMAEHEGIPLALRVNVAAETSQNKQRYSRLVVITHTLEKVKTNGLPESNYNETLIDLDSEIVSLFEKNNRGVTALIETFGGNRNYYIYVLDSVDIEAVFNSLKTEHPQQKLSLFKKADPNWSLLMNYKKDYPW